MNVRRQVSSRLIFWMTAGLLFGLAYSQAPLYTSNQNQYFLHGLAAAGYGHLSQDWLANTQDPTPAFSVLTQASFAWFGPGSFYLEYLLLLGAYLWGLFTIVGTLFPGRLTSHRRLVFLALLTLLHAEALRYILARVPWTDGGYLLEGGVAGQRLLGTVLEPSAFGALLVVSIALFLRDRPHWAALLAAGSASVHPTYLVTAGTLVLAYMGIIAVQDRQPFRALSCGGLALAAVVPILVHTAGVFGLSPSTVSADAARVLVDFRIPHHAQIASWLDPSVAVKAALMLGALGVVRRSRLLPILLAPASLGFVLTLLQAATGSDRLALLFPWRVSTLLVPLSTAILAGRTFVWVFDRIDPLTKDVTAWAERTSWATLAILTGVGVTAFVLRVQTRLRAPEQALFAEVRSMATSNQVFLIPPKLQDFRLATGQPAYVDFKSIPYQPSEVLEWYDRVQLAQFFYRDDPANVDCHLLNRAMAAGVTHVVLDEPLLGIHCENLHKLWGNDTYEIDRLTP